MLDEVTDGGGGAIDLVFRVEDVQAEADGLALDAAGDDLVVVLQVGGDVGGGGWS